MESNALFWVSQLTLAALSVLCGVVISMVALFVAIYWLQPYLLLIVPLSGLLAFAGTWIGLGKLFGCEPVL